MKPFMRGARLGAGLVGLGYGVYRFVTGRRDWMASTAVTTGLTMTLSGLRRRNRADTTERLQRMMGQLDLAFPIAVMRALR